MFEYVIEDDSIVPQLTEIETISDVLGMGLNILIGVGVSLSLVFIGLAGIRYIMAGGNPDNMEQAQKSLTYSIVALVLTVGAIAVKYIFFSSILGIDDSGLVNPTPGDF